MTLPCTRAEAEALPRDLLVFAEMDVPPVLMTSEPDPARPEEWRLDAYFDERPDSALVKRLTALVPSARGVAPVIERLVQEDWVTLSQQGLEPVRAGRFFVRTPSQARSAPPGSIELEIDAGLAFGTGHHETTTGCLEAIDRMQAGGAWFRNILDLGTGTGLLAFAAQRLWPHARVAASDIDPIAIRVVEENARVNGVPIGRLRGQVEPLVAAGLDHRRLRTRAPYDLVLANILAGPLIELAPSLAAAIAPGGRLVLAGLLETQADRVLRAYWREGFVFSFRVDRGEWPSLVLRKRRGVSARRSAGPA